MSIEIKRIVDDIGSLPPDWHLSGPMSKVVLQAMFRHIEGLGVLRHSAETGSGKTTLLFSQLSEDHTVFALDCGQSISRVKGCPLFKQETVTYIEGPSQLTLPRYTFIHKLQVVLINGPHGYPFPDLEYYYFYPHIAEGGLLLIDDINIPTIARMLEIIGAGSMFELIEVVEYTAFFRRTAAPVIDPLGDSWELQGFNRAHYEYGVAHSRYSPSSKLRLVTRLIPPQLKKQIPLSWKTSLLKKLYPI